MKKPCICRRRNKRRIQDTGYRIQDSGLRSQDSGAGTDEALKPVLDSDF
jgi:hypothetical protein